MSKITVVPEISPTPGGFWFHVRSTDSESVWSKWFEHEFSAYSEAVGLGLATEQIVEVQKITVTKRTTLKTEATVETGDLVAFGFQTAHP
jgi:hypothetical protein